MGAIDIVQFRSAEDILLFDQNQTNQSSVSWLEVNVLLCPQML
jgi:hypothetical protein